MNKLSSRQQHYLGNLNCLYCHSALSLVQTDLLSDWHGEELLCCFNDTCKYTRDSWETMRKQGVPMGYRYFFCSTNGSEGALLIQDKDSYRDRVREWEDSFVEGNNEEVSEETDYDRLVEAIKTERDDQIADWLQQLLDLKYPYGE